MKKALMTIILLSAACVSQCALAQAKKDLWSSVSTTLSGYGHDRNHYEIIYTLGYNLTNRFSIALVGEEGISLFDSHGKKDHYVNSTIGASVGYDVLKQISFNVGAGVTYDDKPWKYVYYNAMVCFKHQYGRAIPTFGFGMKYYDSLAKSFSNHWRGYVSFGCIVII